MSTSDNLQKLTPAEWERLTGYKIFDPDGWRGAHAQSFETPIDYEEWNWRMQKSTVQLPMPRNNDKLKENNG